ncbi:uncharacterized protein LOC135222253 [Macrobrachium nipponense]|uniref:uncharacterized protein LOC135222253 n=1 Tax=Macrobrachium nipponense TaxID=159736 RepID=UPI0030C7A9DD
MIFQCVQNAFGAFFTVLMVFLRIVFAGGINWRTSLETEFRCCDAAQRTLLDFRRENRMRRILYSILNYIGLSNLIAYEEPSLSACNGPLQTLLRNTLPGLQRAAADEDVLRKLEKMVLLPEMFLFLTGVVVTLLFIRGTRIIVGRITEARTRIVMEEDVADTTQIEEEEVKQIEEEDTTERKDTIEMDKVEEQEMEVTQTEDEENTEIKDLREMDKEDEEKEVTETEDVEKTERKEDREIEKEEEKEVAAQELERDLENEQVENVEEVPLEERREEEEDVVQKERKEITLINGDLYEFSISEKEKLILRKRAAEVREFTKFYNVRLDLPEDDTKEIAYLKGVENRVEKAFLHIQEIFDEYQREGYNIVPEKLDAEDPSPPPEELVQEAETAPSFAAMLKRGSKLEKVKKQTFFIVQRRTFPVMEEEFLEEDDEEDMDFEIDYESEEEEDWEEPEEIVRETIIVGVSLREAPEEEGQGGMTRLVPKSLVPKERSLPLKEKDDDTLPREEAEEEKVPLQEADKLEKEEELDIQEDKVEEQNLIPDKEEGAMLLEEKQDEPAIIRGKDEERDHVEETEEAQDLALTEAEQENVLPEEKEVRGSEGMAAVVQEAAEKMSYANMAKTLPEQKNAALSDHPTTKPTGPVCTSKARQAEPVNNLNVAHPHKIGPLRHCGGRTYSFLGEKDLDMGCIIGKGGKFAKRAKQDHGVVMNVRNDGSRIVQLTGLKKNVEKVYDEIRFRVDKTFDIKSLTQVSRWLYAVGKEDFVMTVHRQFREAIVGPRQETLRKLVKELEVAIYLPDQDDERDFISIFGPLERALDAETMISEMIEDIQNWPKQVDLRLFGFDFYEFDLPLEGRHLALKGQVAQEIRRLFKVSLILPKDDDHREVGYLGGDLEQVMKAYEHLKVLLKQVSARGCEITTEGLTTTGADKYRFDVVAKHKGLLVGPNGKNLRTIEDKNNVKIIVHKKTDGFVTIQGLFSNVEAACVDIREAMRPTVFRGENKTAQQGGRTFPQEEIIQG